MKNKLIALLFMLFGCLSLILAQEKTIKGTVVDNVYNEAIIGASIIVKNSPDTRGTISDANGAFSLKAKSGEILEITYMGYKAQSITIGESTTVMKIVLEEDLKTLDEIVVVGFGTQKKENLTGAVASVDTKALEARPVSSVGQALQGVVPGLNFSVNASGGGLGNNLDMNIRGTGTIGTGSSASPLILIDGMEGNMNTINPEDIENISVLKDAASSSIYGSRAAFGVILITTKKGKSGKMKVNYNNSFRYSGPINMPRPLDSYSFANYFNDAAQNQGDNPVFGADVIDRILAYQKGEITTSTIPNGGGTNWEFHQKANDNIDWYKEHFKWNWSQEHNVSLTGGSDNIQYYASAGYLAQDGNLRYGNDEYSRFTATAKVNTQVNKYVDINLNVKFIRWELDNPLYMDEGGLLFHDIARVWPMMPLKDPNGHYMRNGKISQLENGGRSKTTNDNLYAQGQVVLHPLKGWDIYADIGARIINQDNSRNLAKVYEYNVEGQPLLLPFAASYAAGATFARDTYAKTNFWNSNIYTDYTFKLEDHFIKGMVGMNTESNHYKTLGAQRSDVISDLIPNIGAATGDDKITSISEYEWATAGFFGRLNYTYMDKYLFEMNLRYDGTSRFLKKDRWNLFPSVSVGWNLAREDFMKSIAETVHTIKPRFSWGKLGNQNTSSYYPFYLTQGITSNWGGWITDGKLQTIAGVPGLVSSSLTWEKIYNTNVGIDVGLLNNRLLLSYDYFIRTTDDMVGPPREIGAALGTGLPNTNNAKLSNKGWELQINWRDQISKVSYDLGFNLSDNRVKVNRYPNPSGSLETYYIDQILGDIWGYETQGIAKTDEEMAAWLSEHDQSKLGSNWQAGDIMYKDLDGNGIIDGGTNTLGDYGDKKVIGNSNPRFRFGFNMGASWNNFDVSLFFQGVMKRDVWLSGPMFWGADGGMWQSMGLKEHLDFFRPADTESVFGPNLDSYYPRAYIGGKGDKNKQVQSRYLQNGAYLRLKNIQLGYNLPSKFVKRIGLEKVRVFGTAENLFTITKMDKMFDPEANMGSYSSGKTYPLSSTIAFGVNITL